MRFLEAGVAVFVGSVFSVPVDGQTSAPSCDRQHLSGRCGVAFISLRDNLDLSTASGRTARSNRGRRGVTPRSGRPV